jgi:hypothetical protein
VLFHGGGRLVTLGDGAEIAADRHLETELAGVYPLGDQILAMQADGQALVLGRDLTTTTDFRVGCPPLATAAIQAKPERPILLDVCGDVLCLRDLSGATLARMPLASSPRAIALAPSGAQAALLLDGQLLLLDLPLS